jgi:long-chain fatty acid transport protein
MRLIGRSFLTAAVSAAALAAAMGAAMAGGFAVREQSATAQGLSFAGAASGSGGLSSAFWNPATLTMRPGWNSEYHFSGIIPTSKIKPTAGTSPALRPFGPSGDIGQDAIVPAGYSAYQFNERVWLGLATSAPFGLVTDPRENWAGQIYSRSSKIVTYNINPIFAYKHSDFVSVGFGPVIQYIDVRLKRALSPLPNTDGGILEGDDFSLGFTAGVTLTPFAGTTIGVGYRSTIQHELNGSQRIPGLELPIRAKLNLPDQINVGISQVVTPDFIVHAGFEWANWSRLKTPAIRTEGLGVIGDLPLNYDDGFFYSLGAEYRFAPQWIARAGVAYEQSPIDLENRSTRLPDNDRVWLSAGLTYQYSQKLSIDLSYTHIFVRETKIDISRRGNRQDLEFAGTTPLNFAADVDSNVNIISAAIKYRWDDPKVAIPAPVITKY